MLIPGLCMNYPYMEAMFCNYAEVHGELAAECLRDYAWLQNTSFITKFDVSFPNTMKVFDTFKKLAGLGYTSETRFFALSIENMITTKEISVQKNFNPEVFKIILDNLENSHQNVRALLLEQFKGLVNCFVAPPYYTDEAKIMMKQHGVKIPNTDDEKVEMVSDILKLPWTSRNKFALLSHVVLLTPELLVEHPKFNLPSFIDGIFIGPTLHHLHAPSQALVKVMHNKVPFSEVLIQKASKFLWECEEDVVIENLTKCWFSVFEPSFIEKLFIKMSHEGKLQNIPTTSRKFHRLLVLRNAFKKKFKDTELDSRIQEFACTFDDLQIKIEIFHILFDNIFVEPQLENILSLLAFLRFNMCVQGERKVTRKFYFIPNLFFTDSSFVDQHVTRKLPDFFNLLATRKFRNIEFQREIFGIIRDDICLHGFGLGSYEAVSFSLKTLNIILKQYCGGEKSSLNKNTNIEGNASLGKFLKDNGIWDLTSTIIFNHLIKLVDESENSDVSGLAMKILVEFFIQKSVVEEIEQIDEKIEFAMNHTEFALSRGAQRFFILKFESTLMKGFAVKEMLSLVDSLKSRFEKMRQDADPAKSMQEGLNLFNVIECVSYGLKRMNPEEVKIHLMPVVKILLGVTVRHFLDMINDPSLLMSFEVVDKKLSEMTGNDFKLKPKLLLFIFYTLRASSELAETLATIVDRNDKDFSQTIAICIDVNMTMLTRSCHKGVIEKASEALGRITKIVSKEFSNLCVKNSEKGRKLHGLLVTLKREIDCAKLLIGDTRSSRGLILMAHQIIINHPPFLRFLIDALLVSTTTNSFTEVRFKDEIKPIQLHLLAILVRDSALVEEMLKYLHFILLATLKAYKESTDFVVLNALLQVISAVVPKISNQKRQNFDEDSSTMVNYEPKSVTVHEFCAKFPGVFQIGLFDLQKEVNSLPNTYIIILLEIFSNFELRGENNSDIDQLRKVFEVLMEHRCEKIRTLSGRCYAQFSEVNDNMLHKIEEKILLLFSLDTNIVHSTVNLVRFMMQRYESCTKFVDNFNYVAFKLSLRNKISCEFKKQEFFGANNFFIRYHLLDFLTFIDFSKDDEVVQSLMLEKGLKDHFGYKLWSEKLKKLQEK
jgi:Putative death-receptor fusion protein (DUF2428)